jgi:hypothetical protein
VPIDGDTALAEGERAVGADPNLFRIFGLMWGAIRMIDPWLSQIPASRAVLIDQEEEILTCASRDSRSASSP